MSPKPDDDLPPLLGAAKTKTTFAKNNAISLPTLNRLISLGRGPTMTRLGGKTVIFPEDELAWRRAQRDLIDEEQRALTERRRAHCREIAKKGGRKKR